MPHRPQPRPQHPGQSGQSGQSGITIVEVMVGFVLVGILMAGMNAVWVAVARRVDDAVLRQQAVIRLNSEMERLSIAYITGGDAGVKSRTVSDYATAAPMAPGYEAGSYIGTSPDGVSRRIYRTGQPGIEFADRNQTGGVDFDEPIADDKENAQKVYGRIFYFDNDTASTTSDDRNLVWIDKGRRVVGQLSWELLPVNDSAGTRPCYPAGTATPCNLLTVFLDYPFRFSADNPRGAMGPVETITLQTIVGQRP
ncbi:type IV pilus modification PilV family protein [Azospirillum rugosum]|uniref:Type II secretory pathway pseudopilin PulG n=1 Tax=Azospirillum rugosum TaxID=416170 RepID=A0ABS4SSE0_9PROT|nr:prepilin-type N-terminal cleavage/methylation domain-containing protein [Azospirillum rugosum]MBP2295468.1 type II secretory pathway pseudopilin PulG [Azospirillum rugosum]MDQ0528347.1 type II secretory pathway pseudopilin PulG [Azospirillum rugosum]